jgi:hypothetical protein
MAEFLGLLNAGAVASALPYLRKRHAALQTLGEDIHNIRSRHDPKFM